MAVTLNNQKITEQWNVVLESGAGRRDVFYQCISTFLQASELPNVEWQLVEATPSFLKGLMGKQHQYLRVTNRCLKDFRMYIGARDYGRHLAISWFLTVEPGYFKRWFSTILTKGTDSQALSYFNLDLFDQQELAAYVCSVHRCCVKRAVENVLSELGQESNGFDWQSKGFLKVW